MEEETDNVLRLLKASSPLQQTKSDQIEKPRFNGQSAAGKSPGQKNHKSAFGDAVYMFPRGSRPESVFGKL